MNIRIGGSILVVLLLLATPAAAQSASTDPATAELSDEVRGVREALDRLVVLLEETRSHQRIELLLKRIELRERRLEPMERRLQSAEKDAQEWEAQLDSLARMREQQEAALDQEIQDGLDSPQSETRRLLADIRRSREGAEERLETARLRVQLYENELADDRRQVEILDDMLMDLLDEESR